MHTLCQHYGVYVVNQHKSHQSQRAVSLAHTTTTSTTASQLAECQRKHRVGEFMKNVLSTRYLRREFRVCVHCMSYSPHNVCVRVQISCQRVEIYDYGELADKRKKKNTYIKGKM